MVVSGRKAPTVSELSSSQSPITRSSFGSPKNSDPTILPAAFPMVESRFVIESASEATKRLWWIALGWTDTRALVDRLACYFNLPPVRVHVDHLVALFMTRGSVEVARHGSPVPLVAYNFERERRIRHIRGVPIDEVEGGSRCSPYSQRVDTVAIPVADDDSVAVDAKPVCKVGGA